MEQRSTRDRRVVRSETERGPFHETSDHDDHDGRGAHFGPAPRALHDVRDADGGTGEEQSGAEGPPTT